MSARSVYLGAPTFTLPPDAGTNAQVVTSNGDGSTEWATLGPGGGAVDSIQAGENIIVNDSIPPGSISSPVVSMPIANGPPAASQVVGNVSGKLAWVNGGLQSVSAGTNVLIDETIPADPVINVKVSGTYVNTYVVGSTDGGDSMTWQAPTASGGVVDSIQAGSNIVVNTTVLPGTVSAPVISMPIAGSPPTGGQVIGNAAGVLTWVAPGVATVAVGNYLQQTGTAKSPILNLNVATPGTDGEILSSTAAGVLSWVAPGISSIEVGDYLALSGTPAVPKIDLDLGFPDNDGDILSSTIEGVLSWVTPEAGGVVESIAPGFGIAVSTEAPNSAAAPLVSFDVGGAAGANRVPAYVAPVGAGPASLVWADIPAAGGIVDTITPGLGIAVSTTAPDSAAAPALSIATNNAPTATGQLLSYVNPTFPAVVGSCAWVSPPVTSIGGADYIFISGSPGGQVVELNITAPAEGTPGQMLTCDADTTKLKWANNPAAATYVANISNPTWVGTELDAGAPVTPNSIGTVTGGNGGVYRTGNLCMTTVPINMINITFVADFTSGNYISLQCVNMSVSPPPTGDVLAWGSFTSSLTSYDYPGLWKLIAATGEIQFLSEPPITVGTPLNGDVLWGIMPQFIYTV